MSKLATNLFTIVIAVTLIAACTTAPDKATLPAAQKPVKKSTPYYERGIQLAKEGQDKQAIEQFTLMTRQNPEIAVGYTNLGLLQLKAGNLEQAEQAFAQAIALNSEDKVAHNHLGVSLRQRGQFAKAGQSYLAALKIDGNYAAAHLNLAILYDIYQQKLPSALQHYQRYQSLTGESDKLVTKWIVDLKRRISASKRK